MNDDQRRAGEAVLASFETIAPMERKLRRSDVLFAVSGVAALTCFASLAFNASPWWAAAWVLMAGVMGFLAGQTAVGIRERRRAFAALAMAHEFISLELALDDGEEEPDD